MIVFVSDLHLEDSPHFTIDIPRFIGRLEQVCCQARKRGAQHFILVLLGDIFELLKSARWVENEVRPWETVTDRHVKTVTEVFRGVLQTNRDFFSGLSSLSETYNMPVHYVVGNHDLPLNTALGAGARALLLEVLPPLVRGDDGMFREEFRDRQHRVIARHGHEWDETNRYGGRGAAIGDAVVTEFLVRLPMEIDRGLRAGNLERGDDLWFLKEIDNVRPQDLRTMEKWLRSGLAQCGSEERQQEVTMIVKSCLKRLLKDFRKRCRKVKFESTRVLAPLLWVIQKVGPLRVARGLASAETPGTYRHFALQQLLGGTDFRYFLCGHTHIPEIVPLDPGDSGGLTRLYLNTGTWRRVWRRASTRAAKGCLAGFAGWDEECLVAVYDEEEQIRHGCPPFEYHRVNRGLPG